MTTRRLLAAAVPAVVLGLCACTAPQAAPLPDDTFVAGPSAEPTPDAAITPNPIEPDTTLIVRATASASNGARLSLELQVHRSSPWDYVGTQTLPAAIIEDCGEPFTAELFAAEQWSFTRANVTAIPVDAGAWPVEARVTVEPTGGDDPVSGRGILTAECSEPKQLSATGKGAIALGISGDGATQTAWSARRWGFSAGPGVTLSDCTFELTALGTQLGGTGAQVSDASTCTVGP